MAQRYCKKCDSTTQDMFCPGCGSLTTFVKEAREPPKSMAGETFVCEISQGANFSRGIKVSAVDKKKYFNRREGTVILHLDGERCIAPLSQSFWGTASSIKVAKNHSGKNFLTKWIEKHELLPASISEKRKGRPDLLFLTVVQPEQEFRVKIPTDEELDEFRRMTEE